MTAKDGMARAEAPRPKPADLLRIIRVTGHGSAVDPPRSSLQVLLEALRGQTAPGSAMTMKEAMASPIYRDLWTPRIRVGDSAIPFELPLLETHGDVQQTPGKKVRLAEYLGRQPLALIFGSYT